MTDIFLSYCRRDTDFVVKLKADIEKLGYTTWMDNDRIDGGDQWEAQIEAALEQANLFIVIVSQDSNESNWVRRETIRAEQLQKMRIPILLNAELPLRLLDLQYVDFRGSYEGGIADLFPLLEKNLGKKEDTLHQKELMEEADRLMGAALRALLQDDRQTANEKAQQALVLRPIAIAQSTSQLWIQISRQCQKNFPSSNMWWETGGGRAQQQQQQQQQQGEEGCHVLSHIKLVEHSKLSEKERPWSSRQFYSWTLHLDAPPNILKLIDRVKYNLHPSFHPPSQVVRDRTSGFLLHREAWGTFPVQVELFCIDGTSFILEHELTFEEAVDSNKQQQWAKGQEKEEDKKRKRIHHQCNRT